MQTVDATKTELDVLDFGTLCHAALEKMGLTESMRDCTDARVLHDFLISALEDEVENRFGSELTLPLIVQLESARQRLFRAAEVQAATRAEGWRIDRVEESFQLTIDGLLITGKIDRIDRHENTGAVRVLDYKTSDRPVEPWQAHLRAMRRNEQPPEFARVMLNARAAVWSDLQLPLYRRAFFGNGIDALVTPADEVQCGYFNLPKASGDTGIRPWLDYSPDLEASAWTCAVGVANAIRTGVYWPPNENVRAEYDEFAPLFHHGVAASVSWNGPSVHKIVDGRFEGSG